jgi:hypothetical protein
MSSISSDTVSTDWSDIQSIITESGFKWNPSTIAKYVCHTHTIPLCTIIDDNLFFKDDESSLNHSRDNEVKCGEDHCMFKRSNSLRRIECIPLNCPCKDVQKQSTSELVPLCFLEVLRRLAPNLSNEAETMKHDEIMFCKSNCTIFDNSYPARIRDRVKASSFDNVKRPDQIIGLMLSLYWFRIANKNNGSYVKRIKDLFNGRTFFQGTSILKQVLYTINGCLIKKFLAFPQEISSYEEIAKQTAKLFLALLRDYEMTPILIEGVPVEPTTGAYVELKKFCNFVKENFHKDNEEIQEDILYYKFTEPALRSFWGTELYKLGLLIKKVWTQENEHYMQSLAWYYRMSILAQTRVLGYLPKALATAKEHLYRKIIGRFPIQVPKEDLHLIYTSVRAELKRNSVPEFFLEREDKTLDDETKTIFLEVMSKIELVVKPTASVRFTVLQGGKLEDARITLNKAMENNWQIPVRDLYTNEIKEYIKVIPPEEGDYNYTRPIFWISYQLALNVLIKKGLWRKQDYCLLQNSEDLENEFLDARVLHVQEPGKDRNLTKSSAHLAWVLTPAGKICQSILSMLPEHKVGLTGSSHGWKYGRRISGLSSEASFVYNKTNSKLDKNFVQCFGDWTESTDFIEKEVGFALLRAIMDYVGFPTMYEKVVLTLIVQPQPVTEVVRLSSENPEEQFIIPWKGFIRNGYMMGNPVTKTILHSLHIVELAISKEILLQFGKSHLTGNKIPIEGLIHIDRKQVVDTILQMEI